METTLEVRWFGPGSPPDAVTIRFDDLGAPGPQGRTDTYLPLSGNEDLGVKLRDGSRALEFKLRRREFSDAKLTAAGGHIERWQKWSLPIDDEACRAAGLGLPGESRVEVDKSHRLLTYRLAADGSAALAAERPGDGCSVEVTRLRVRGEPWWSVGCEAFGAEHRLTDALAAATAAFFTEDVAGALTGTLSCGYPAWLSRLTGAGATEVRPG